MKVLVLGAGPAQADLIRHLLGRGMQVVVASSRPSTKEFMTQVDFRKIDIVDKVAILDLASSCSVDLIYSVGSDLAMPTVAYASEQLGLPRFVSANVAELFQNKASVRSLLATTKYSVAFQSGSSIQDFAEWKTYPCMMKPVDSQGQRGIRKISGTDELVEHFSDCASHSKSGTVILEEFLPGQEFSVNLYFRNGEIVFLLPSRRISFSEYPGGIIKQHLLDDETYLVEQCRDLALEIARVTGFLNGPLYLQTKLDASGGLKLIEAAARLDGCHMWKAIKAYCGYDLLENAVKHLEGRDLGKAFIPQMDRLQPRKLVFLTARPGETLRPGLELEVPKDSLESELYYEAGHIVQAQNGYQEKVGYWIGNA